VTRARHLFLLILPLGLLAGCAGQLRDYVGSRSSIVRPQLIRYGFTLTEISCVGGRLGDTLRPRQLRFLTRAASRVPQPFYDSTRFAVRDLVWVARNLEDQRIRVELARALAACNVQVQQDAPAPVIAAILPETAMRPAAARPSVWLNLGAAGSGQAIAVDGATLEQQDSARIAWFRMIDPPPGGPSVHAYRLRIDCRARTIQPLGHRLYDAAGAITEEREYLPNEEAPTPVEGGTVTEIAFLSLCT
jgi:hypothetical protein